MRNTIAIEMLELCTNISEHYTVLFQRKELSTSMMASPLVEVKLRCSVTF